jgi:hypothetical protein
VLSLECIDALKSMQLLRHAPIEAYKRATEEQRKEGGICSPQISSTVMRFYRNLRRISWGQGKDVSLESLLELIISLDMLPFCASWLKFG